jgi:predicted nucleic acid-binding protein
MNAASRLLSNPTDHPGACQPSYPGVPAFDTRQRFGISYWDAAIIEESRRLGCDIVLSEDLDTGTNYDGVRVENPFDQGS